ncbi:MAG: stage III sporulation protein AF [Lachnospiraceae bacterium]|nr:stage III sporulation protein AF [Lachnospiraceae bacterium]
MDMLGNIRRIGMFMIAAQTVIHFAAGKKYEKYLKIIAGVIILLQFMAPFVSSQEEIIEKWQEEIQKMSEQAERQSDMWQEETLTFRYAEAMALREIEDEIKSRLNDVIAGQSYYVAKLSVELEQTDKSIGSDAGSQESEWEFRGVKAALRERVDNAYNRQNERYVNNIEEIEIEKIVIGGEKDKDTEGKEIHDSTRDITIQECRQLFAQTLGIPVDRVEVSYDGE